MGRRLWAMWATAGLLFRAVAGASAADSPAPQATADSLGGATLVPPVWLALVDEPPSVYPEVMPPRDVEGMNAGGVNFGLEIDWLTDYVFRGINQKTPGLHHENALQFNTTANFDLGKLPHPFIGLFVNVFNTDPIARFQEVRPYLGFDWNIKPVTLTAGYTTYIHPNRKNIDTSEVFARLSLDDSRIFRTARPIFAPYIYGAYDVDLYKGFYIEAGLRHDFVFEDVGLTLSPVADIAYVVNNPYFELGPLTRTYGLQHYDIGLIADFSLNHFFRVNYRYGEFSLKGYLYYTGRIDKELRADTLIWGGVGLEFKY